MDREKEDQLNQLLTEVWDAHPAHWIPQRCMPTFNRLTATLFAEMVFTRELFTDGREPSLLLKWRNDEHWPDTWHFPGTKHRPSKEYGNPLQVAQALAELEFKGIEITRAVVVTGFQWKLKSEGGDHPWCNAYSNVVLCEVKPGTLEPTDKQKFLTLEEAAKLTMATHHLDYFKACREFSMTGKPFVYSR